MEKKESNNAKNMKNENNQSRKMKITGKTKNQKDKFLPWWVELLFVQIGLPDKFLIGILKISKIIKELIKNEKKSIFLFLFILFHMIYFYPVVKHSKNKLDCEKNAKSYVIQNKNLNKISKKQLGMLSTNFCNGGEEIYEIQNLN